MQSREQKTDVSNLILQHVSHLRMGVAGMVQYHFADDKKAAEVVIELKRDPRLTILGNDNIAKVSHDRCHQSLPGVKCHIVRLNEQQFNHLWKRKSYDELKRLNQLHQDNEFDQLGKELLNLSIQNSELYQQLLILRDPKHWCILQTVLRYLPPEINATLIQRASNDILNHALVLQDEDGWCTLQTAFSNLPPEICAALIERVSNDTLNHALVLQDKDDWCTLQMSFRKLPSEINATLIRRASNDILNHALVLQDENGWCTLKIALRYHPPEINAALIERVSNDTLNHALVLQDNDAWPTLQTAFRYQSPEICATLIEHASNDALNQTLGLQNKHGWSTIMRVAYYLPSPLFINLINKVSATSLVKGACLLHPDTESTFEVAAQYQSHLAFKRFLQKINHSTDAILLLQQFFNDHPKNLLSIFKRIALYQSSQNMLDFIALLTSAQQETLISICKDKIDQSDLRLALRALQQKLSSIDVEMKSICHTTESVIPLNGEPNRFFALIQDMLAPLKSFDASESKREFDRKSFNSISIEQSALNLLQQGAFVKIIRDDQPENNTEFLIHFHDPQKRQDIRDPQGNDKQGFKALLAPQEDKKRDHPKAFYRYPNGIELIPCRTLPERIQHKANKPPYTHTVKTPATYVSAKQHTGLFGYHDREMVGYVFTEQAKIKLLSTQDIGTYRRPQVNKDRHALIGNINHLQNLICRTFQEFKQRVAEQPYVVNEALIQVSDHELFAIVIGKDTSKARDIAVQRRLTHIEKYHRDLPIIFYHPEKMCSEIYTTLEQQLDHPHLFLASLKKQIEQKYKKLDFPARLFKQAPNIEIQMDYENFTLNEKEITTILKIITHTKNASQAFNQIKIILTSNKEKLLLLKNSAPLTQSKLTKQACHATS